MLEYCVASFLDCDIKELVIVCKDDEKERIQEILNGLCTGKTIKYVSGGEQRQQSSKNGVDAINGSTTHVLIHDCARMLITPEIINRCILALEKNEAVITAMPLKDTIKIANNDKVISTPDRSNFIIVQTPQCFSLPLIKEAHKIANKTNYVATDDAGLIEHIGREVKIIEGSYENIKITTKDDIIVAENILIKREKRMDKYPPLRIGNGLDVHQLTIGRKLILGGVEINHEKGLMGHSDADVLAHAIMDAILGAAGLGDIGVHFPDTDEAYKDANSIDLLKKVISLIEAKNLLVGNIDAVIIAQKPKLLPHIENMRKNISKACGLSAELVNIKATTTENLSLLVEKKALHVWQTLYYIQIIRGFRCLKDVKKMNMGK